MFHRFMFKLSLLSKSNVNLNFNFTKFNVDVRYMRKRFLDDVDKRDRECLLLIQPIRSFSHSILRSSCPEVLYNRLFLKISQNSQESTCVGVSFHKVAGLRPATLLKKRFRHGCFPEYFVNFSRTMFLQNTSSDYFYFFYVILYPLYFLKFTKRLLYHFSKHCNLSGKQLDLGLPLSRFESLCTKWGWRKSYTFDSSLTIFHPFFQYKYVL